MAEWPTRSFDEKPPTNASTGGSKGNPPTTADVPDSSEVTVEHEGEGFDPRNS